MSNDRIRPVVTVACVTALVSATPLAQPAGGPAATATGIPFDFRTKQPIVPVQVNGGPAVPFVVDTGASIHVVDGELARVHLAKGRDVNWHGGGEATVSAQFVDGMVLAFGGRTWPAQRAAVAAIGYPDRKHFAGLIGAPILMQYVVRFDFPARTMRLMDPAGYQPPPGALRVPFELQDDLPIVRVTVDAGTGPVAARLMVDTGAGTAIDLNRPFVERHGFLSALAKATAADRPAALGGTTAFLYANGRSAAINGESVGPAGDRSVGGIVFNEPRLGLSRAQTGSSASAARDGIIGTELLQRYILDVDYSRRLLVLALPVP